MSPAVQAAATGRWFGQAGRLCALLVAALSLHGCGSFSLSKAEADRSILTGAVPSAAPGADPRKTSDQNTIRNAVSSANLAELAGGAIPWANVETDSQGAIFDIVESGSRSEPCRRFKATRESFSGVSMYQGEACMTRAGAWYLRGFKEG